MGTQKDSEDRIVHTIIKSFREGACHGNYTIKIWDSQVKEYCGRSWKELDKANRKLVLTDFET